MNHQSLGHRLREFGRWIKLHHFQLGLIATVTKFSPIGWLPSWAIAECGWRSRRLLNERVRVSLGQLTKVSRRLSCNPIGWYRPKFSSSALRFWGVHLQLNSILEEDQLSHRAISQWCAGWKEQDPTSHPIALSAGMHFWKLSFLWVSSSLATILGGCTFLKRGVSNGKT